MIFGRPADQHQVGAGSSVLFPVLEDQSGHRVDCIGAGHVVGSPSTSGVGGERSRGDERHDTALLELCRGGLGTDQRTPPADTDGSGHLGDGRLPHLA